MGELNSRSPRSLSNRGLIVRLSLAVWGTGQDQAAIIKRQMQLLLPTISTFLDVDDLADIGELETYVDQTAVMLLFLSRGYLLSKNCLREIRASRERDKAVCLVHEAQVERGGAPIEQLVGECPDDLVPYVFGNRFPITWHRIHDLQLVSLKMIAVHVISNCTDLGKRKEFLRRPTGLSDISKFLDTGSEEYGLAKKKFGALTGSAKSDSSTDNAGVKEIEEAFDAEDPGAPAGAERATRFSVQSEEQRRTRSTRRTKAAHEMTIDDIVIDDEITAKPLVFPSQVVLWPSPNNPGAADVCAQLCRQLCNVGELRERTFRQQNVERLTRMRGSVMDLREGVGSKMRGSAASLLKHVRTGKLPELGRQASAEASERSKRWEAMQGPEGDDPQGLQRSGSRGTFASSRAPETKKKNSTLGRGRASTSRNQVVIAGRRPPTALGSDDSTHASILEAFAGGRDTGPDATMMLLYLTNQTFVGEEGETFAEEARAAPSIPENRPPHASTRLAHVSPLRCARCATRTCRS